MFDRKNKTHWFRSRWWLVASSLVAFLIVVSASRAWYLEYTTNRQIHALEEEAKRLESRRLELRSLVERLEQGDFLEAEARLEIGLQKPGESVVVIRPSPFETEATDAPSRSRSNPQRWWDYFVHRK